MTREQIIGDLTQEYQKRRENNLTLYEERAREACARCPGLDEVLTARRAALMTGVRRSLLAKRKDENANAALPNQMAAYNARAAELLKKGGLPADYLAPVYDCAICKDDGFLYEPERKMCACFEKALQERLLAAIPMLDRQQTFERFDLSLFSQDKENGVSQRQMIALIKDKCEAFANEFPNIKTVTNNLLLLGRSGLGKTYLMNCIMNSVAARGYLPEYVSAYRLLDAARKAYFGGGEELLEKYMTANLLLIDDLGTEPLLDNVTVVQLFNLLSERQNAELCTIVSSNFTLKEIKERYTERVASRFGDKSRWTRLDFIGGDVRARLRRPEDA